MIVIGLMIISMMIFSACTKSEEHENKGYQQITAEEAYQEINENQDAVILDVRTKEEYDAGHINGAILLPNESIQEEKPEQLPDLDAEILIYCRSGNRSKQAAEKLVALGYTNVKEFGGILEWTYGIVSSDENSPAEVKQPSMSRFETTDLEGNAVTQEIFSEYDLTMINVWGTYCTPCLREMPDLGKINKEYKENGVQIIGIPIDVFAPDGNISEDQVKKVKGIIKDTNASYIHLLPSEDLIYAKLKDVDVIPYTFFVNSQGEIIGDSYAGSKSEEEWKQIIKEKLNIKK